MLQGVASRFFGSARVHQEPRFGGYAPSVNESQMTESIALKFISFREGGTAGSVKLIESQRV